MTNPVQVTVNFGTSPPTSTPDPVHVHKGQNEDGIQWVADRAGYTFTGVSIDPNPSAEFHDPAIGTAENGASTITVVDDITDYGSHKYTLTYNDPQGHPHTYDPRIKNDN